MQDERHLEPTALARPVPSEHRTFDRDGTPVILRGVVTHVAGRRVAFEYHHPERGLWHLWVPGDTCFPVKGTGVTETAWPVDDGGPRGVRTHNLRIKSPQLCQLS
jgi:hypothetical protein